MQDIIKPSSVDEYIAQFPIETQFLLNQLREVIKSTAPEAIECIAYNMPAYKYLGALVYFAGYKNHIGFYPGAAGILDFMDEVKVYKFAKGSVQFPLNQPIPVDLIRKIVVFRLQQNREKDSLKKQKKSATK